MMELPSLAANLDATVTGVGEWLDIIDAGSNLGPTNMYICFVFFAHESNP